MRRAGAIHVSAVRLRPAVADDIPAVVRLEQASFAAGHRFSRRQISYLIGCANATVVVAQAKRQLLGWGAGLIRRLPGRPRVGGRVYSLAVAPQARGMRIGQRLMSRILRELRTRGARTIWLEVRAANRAAIGLYERFGFAVDRRLPAYYGAHIAGLRMRLDVV
jgi:[ribosomal protein S18]-alanine N-acetyltransferase